MRQKLPFWDEPSCVVEELNCDTVVVEAINNS